MEIINIYRDFTKEQIITALEDSCKRVNAPAWVSEILDEAVTSELWNWKEEYDGCTAVQDPFHPYPPCFIHDFMFRTGRGGKDSAKIFKHTQIIFGAKKINATMRAFATSVAWVVYYKWAYRRKGCVRPLTKGMVKAVEACKLK